MSLLFVFLIIFASFISGQALRYAFPNKITFFRDIAAFIALKIAIPISIAGSLWALKIENDTLILLPIIGTGVLLAGFLLGLIISRAQNLKSIQRGVVAPAAAYTNIGGVGAFAVFSFLGEQGFALVPLYKLFEELIYFGILFPFAARHSNETEIAARKWWKDPTIQIMLAALVIGFGLNLSGISRPNFIEGLLSFTIPIGAFFMMLTTGVIFQFKNIKKNIPKALPVVILKPTVLFLTAFALILLFDIHSLPNAQDIIGVCIILAIMPTAFLASIPASLYKLDVDLANTIWIFSTCLLCITLPLIPYLITL